MSHISKLLSIGEKLIVFILPLILERMLNMDEAIGILYTEYKSYSREKWCTKCPAVIVSTFLRAAQNYSPTFKGICYRKLMQKNSK